MSGAASPMKSAAPHGAERSAAFEKAHTEECAARIVAFWEARGEKVAVKIVRGFGGSREPTMLGIRSNLRNGRPFGGPVRHLAETTPPPEGVAVSAMTAAKRAAAARRDRIVRLLRSAGSLAAGDLARRLGERYADVQRGLERLEEIGVVARQPASLSGRLAWRLTERAA